MAPLGQDEEDSNEDEQDEDSEEEEESDDEDGDEGGGWDYGWNDNDADDEELDLSNMNLSSDLLLMMGASEEQIAKAKAAHATDWKPPEETGLHNSTAIAQFEKSEWNALRKGHDERVKEVRSSATDASPPPRSSTSAADVGRATGVAASVKAPEVANAMPVALEKPALDKPQPSVKPAPEKPQASAKPVAAVNAASQLLPTGMRSSMPQDTIAAAAPVAAPRGLTAATLAQHSAQHSASGSAAGAPSAAGAAAAAGAATSTLHVDAAGAALAPMSPRGLRVKALEAVPKSQEKEVPQRPRAASKAASEAESSDDSDDDSQWDEVSWKTWSEPDSDAEPEDLQRLSPNLLRLLGKEDMAVQRERELRTSVTGAWEAPARPGLENSRRIVELAPVRVGGQKALEVREDHAKPLKASGSHGKVATTAAREEPDADDDASAGSGGSNNSGGSWDDDSQYDIQVLDDDAYLSNWTTNVSSNLRGVLGLRRDTAKVADRLKLIDWRPPEKPGLGNSAPLMPVRGSDGASSYPEPLRASNGA